MMPFCAEKYYHLVSAHPASAGICQLTGCCLLYFWYAAHIGYSQC